MNITEANRNKSQVHGVVALEEGETLLSCPFCGSDASLRTDSGPLGTTFWAKCNKRECGVTCQSGPYRGKVVEKWNSRAA